MYMGSMQSTVLDLQADPPLEAVCTAPPVVSLLQEPGTVATC